MRTEAAATTKLSQALLSYGFLVERYARLQEASVGRQATTPNVHVEGLGVRKEDERRRRRKCHELHENSSAGGLLFNEKGE